MTKNEIEYLLLIKNFRAECGIIRTENRNYRNQIR